MFMVPLQYSTVQYRSFKIPEICQNTGTATVQFNTVNYSTSQRIMSYCTEISWNISGQLKKWDFCEINLHGIAKRWFSWRRTFQIKSNFTEFTLNIIKISPKCEFFYSKYSNVYRDLKLTVTVTIQYLFSKFLNWVYSYSTVQAKFTVLYLCCTVDMSGS